jgi:energy-coupling factor transporter transmembrane protein EcfT
MTKKDVIALGITSIYRFVYYFSFLIFMIFYIVLLVIWTTYFTQKKNLYELIQKNNLIESSIYRAINIYDLMVFHNYTLDEVTNKILSDYINNEKNALIKSFYYDIEIAFNSIKEKNKIRGIYQDFEDTSNFTCENLFKLNS